MRTISNPVLCTRASLEADLHRLGVQPGDTLLLHSSLSALGWVCGGAEAVVLAMLDVLGPGGTLVVPTHSGDNSDPTGWENPPVPPEWWPVIRETMPAYDPATTRTRGMGVIAETVRTWPGAVRSGHPQTSFAAVGPRAALLTAGHAVDCQLGEHSPLARLEESQARVLLLGVGFAACTAFHLAEYRVGPPIVSNSFAVMDGEGCRKWMTVQDAHLAGERFEELGSDFEQNEVIIRGRIGSADARLFALGSAVAYAQGWLATSRRAKEE